MADPIFVGFSDQPVHLLPNLANRHGLIAGATGTGKTVTLQILAEQFSQMGVPVFMADVKGDLSGISQVGGPHPKLEERAKVIGLESYPRFSCPTLFWDVFGEQGHKLRATVSEMGPLLLARLLDLSEAQEGVLNIAFKIADDEGLLLIDLKDLRAMLGWVAENAKEIQAQYGLVSAASVGAIQRSLLVLEQQGGDSFLGEPALDLRDLMRTTHDGKGYVNILASDKLMSSPRLYATFLLWLLSELFEEMPEVGDLDKPKLVFFFDEAHLLFNDAPKALVEKVEQVVRLIRSKGVGVYFVTQNPLDIPDSVLAQLGNRVQHALRAFTPRDLKAVNAAADTFRPNPLFKTSEVITTLGVGEALVSTLEAKGTPIIVQKTLIRPPGSRLGPATLEERKAVINSSPVAALYDREVDRESAFELITKRTAARDEEEAQIEAEKAAAKQRVLEEKELAKQAKEADRAERAARPRASNREGVMEAVVKSAGRAMAGQLGRQLVRGVLGSLFKKR
jgi:DNA helicase HerA-like ATPase